MPGLIWVTLILFKEVSILIDLTKPRNPNLQALYILPYFPTLYDASDPT